MISNSRLVTEGAGDEYGSVSLHFQSLYIFPKHLGIAEGLRKLKRTPGKYPFYELAINSEHNTSSPLWLCVSDLVMKPVTFLFILKHYLLVTEYPSTLPMYSLSSQCCIEKSARIPIYRGKIETQRGTWLHRVSFRDLKSGTRSTNPRAFKMYSSLF